MSYLSKQNCVACITGGPSLPASRVRELMTEIPHWQWLESPSRIVREFHFKNFYQTMAFVNALAYVAHREDHHPDLEVGYKRCLVSYRTHAVDGLSDNDFICAAKIDLLLTND